MNHVRTNYISRPLQIRILYFKDWIRIRNPCVYSQFKFWRLPFTVSQCLSVNSNLGRLTGFRWEHLCYLKVFLSHMCNKLSYNWSKRPGSKCPRLQPPSPIIQLKKILPLYG